ncbi:MAG: M15 family metallopeptidase [Proteobacteria bacterium]|nr:M15 family metallopeptidase [Pseudomonadota bacterium]
MELRDAIPSITLDVRYSSADNFVGSPIDGYLAEKIYLERKAVVALAAVQTELSEFRLGLKVFDAYRPQRAVDHFVRWGRDLGDEKMKSRYYPKVAKANLFRDGYIAERSGHSRGSTVDLTLVDLDTAEELDMGTSWDYFDVKSWPSSQAVTAQQRANRMLLHRVMVKQGFRGLRTEWWHFTLEDETFPDTYFDFVIR